MSFIIPTDSDIAAKVVDGHSAILQLERVNPTTIPSAEKDKIKQALAKGADALKQNAGEGQATLDQLGKYDLAKTADATSIQQNIEWLKTEGKALHLRQRINHAELLIIRGYEQAQLAEKESVIAKLKETADTHADAIKIYEEKLKEIADLVTKKDQNWRANYDKAKELQAELIMMADKNPALTSAIAAARFLQVGATGDTAAIAQHSKDINDDINKVNRRLGIGDKSQVTVSLGGMDVQLGGYIGLRILQLLSLTTATDVTGDPSVAGAGATGATGAPAGTSGATGGTPGSGTAAVKTDPATIDQVVNQVTFAKLFGAVTAAQRPSWGAYDNVLGWFRSGFGNNVDPHRYKAVNASTVFNIENGQGGYSTLAATDNPVPDAYKQTAMQVKEPSPFILKAQELKPDGSLKPVNISDWTQWAFVYVHDVRTTAESTVGGTAQHEMIGKVKAKVKEFLESNGTHFYVCVAQVTATEKGKPTPTKILAITREELIKVFGSGN